MRLNFYTEPLSYKEASLYLKFFPGQIEGKFSLHLGGTFTAKGFRDLLPADTNKFSGLMAWFCRKADGKVFLAFESKDDSFKYPEKDSAGAAAIEPLAGNLLIPTEIFGENLSAITNHEAFLRADKRANPAKDDTLTPSEIKPLVADYLNTFKGYQWYGHGYFENETGGSDFITEFLKPADVHYVRYYFGFHSHASPNHIRVLLVPVDKDGKNIDVREKSGTRTDVPILQKSVPPPPY